MRLIILFILMVVVAKSYAQWTPTTTTIRTPYGPPKITSYQYMHQPAMYYQQNVTI
jgi:hypothetical protein